MSSRYPTALQAPWFGEAIEVSLVTARDLHGKATAVKTVKTTGKIKLAKIEMSEGGGLATRDGARITLPANINLEVGIGTIIKDSFGTEYTVIGQNGGHDHRGERHFYTLDCVKKTHGSLP